MTRLYFLLSWKDARYNISYSLVRFNFVSSKLMYLLVISYKNPETMLFSMESLLSNIFKHDAHVHVAVVRVVTWAQWSCSVRRAPAGTTLTVPAAISGNIPTYRLSSYKSSVSN